MDWAWTLLLGFLLIFSTWISIPSDNQFFYLDSEGIKHFVLTPAGMDNTQEEAKFYGAVHLLVRDAAGNEVFSQTIHNRLLDTGENYIIDQAFTGGATDVADTDQISAICVSDQNTVAEADTAASIAGANGLTGGNHCHFTVPTHPGDGTTVLGPEVFTGGTDIGATEIINSIAICSNNAGADYAECNSPGTNNIAFAAIVTSAVQLGATETVDITYTFDLSSLNT